MDGDTATVVDATTKEKVRQRSTIAFPYMDLASAEDVANAIHGHVGLGTCDDSQLAPWTGGQSPKSSTFRVQIYTARIFGLLEGDSSSHKLTELGRAIVDPNQAREARARAFLTVPLYKAIFEKYKGGVLPPAAALERDISALGVSDKQKDRARQVFERSAERAGFFEHGKNRLVMPGIAPGGAGPGGPPDKKGGSGNEPPPPPPPPPPSDELHPFIQGLLKTLPEPETDWPVSGRIKWLQTAANIFDLIHQGEGGGIKVESAVAQRSPRPSD